MFVDEMLKLPVPLCLSQRGCCPEETRKKVKLLTKVDHNVRITINCCGFLVLLPAFQYLKLLLIETSASHPCLVKDSSSPFCLLS